MNADKSEKLDLLRRLKLEVMKQKPVLDEIIKKYGDKKLYEYALDYIDVNQDPIITNRKKEFLETFEKEVTRTLGKEVAQCAKRQLERFYYVSTADHHGPICHPFFISSNLITSAPYFEYPDPLLENVIVLANSNVSLNNSSFPRGLVFHTKADGGKQLQKIAFSPSQNKLSPVFNYPAYTKDDIERMKKQLLTKARERIILDDEAEKIISIVDELYNTSDALSCANYSDQITKTNFLLWRKFFKPHENDCPDLLYLEIESLVNQLILDHHLNKHTVVNHFLFDEEYYPLILKYFEDVSGAFSIKKKIGTYLFWGLPKGSKYRLQLWKKGNKLESDDGSYSIELTPEAIRAGIEKKELVPSMMLSHVIISFYYGVKALGGFSQVNYLTFMKNAYIKMQTDRGNYKSVRVAAQSQTKELCGDVTLAFLETDDKFMTPASGLDLILYGTDHTWSDFLEMSKKVSLEEALNPMMPEFYRIIYSESERTEDLMSLSSEEITKFTGLDKKIKPCISIQP